MKEKNVFNQWKLVKAQRYWRQKQIDAITEAVNDFQPQGNSPESRIFGYAAIYLAFIAQFIEKELDSRLVSAENELNEIPTLAGDSPVDANLSRSLGIFDGANDAGIVVAELIMCAQRALNNATQLTLAQFGGLGLPLFSNDGGVDLYVACSEISKQGLNSAIANLKKCLSITTTNASRAQAVEEFLTPSISSYAAAVSMKTSADVFMETAKMLNQPVTDAGVFENDPAHHAKTKEIQIARIYAAGVASGIINTHLKDGQLWNVQFLN
jgi:hypothetical protein